MKNKREVFGKDIESNIDESVGYNRNPRYNSVTKNHQSGTQNEGKLINKGRGPTRGNQEFMAEKVGPPATKDKFREAPSKVRVSGTAREYPKNIDSQNYGPQYRGVGGTKVEKPHNIDAVRIGQTGGPGYGGTSRGKKVNTDTPNVFNYGPPSQY